MLLGMRLGPGLVALLLCPSAASAAQVGQRSAPPPFELVETSLTELENALRLGRVTSEELVRGYQARITAYDEAGPELNGILALNAEALSEARARDAERRAGLVRGPLHGIPVLVKDNIDVAGLPTTAGSLALAASFPPDDAHLVRRLRARGAVILGKTTLTEFANFLTGGMPSGYHSLSGFGFNPYDPRPAPSGDGRPVLSPGGSSSGTGIAIAASLAAAGVGTETSGSILSPASSNGLVGLKPTVGLISRDGILPITADQDTPGPMARTVRDCALLLSALAGHDPADPATADCAVRGGPCPGDYTVFLDKHALVGARIGVPRSYWDFASGPQRSRLRDALNVLEREGAVVLDPFEIPDQAQLNQRGICTSVPLSANCSSVLLYGFKHDLEEYLTGLGPFAPMQSLADIVAFNAAHPAATRYGQSIALAAVQLDTSPGSADTQRYERDRRRDVELFRGALERAFAGPDGLAATGDELDALFFPANFGADAPARAGFPSLTVPAKFLDPTTAVVNPHPFGITFCGPAWSEPRLLALGYAFEQATRYRQTPTTTPELPR
jgi:amidase